MVQRVNIHGTEGEYTWYRGVIIHVVQRVNIHGTEGEYTWYRG